MESDRFRLHDAAASLLLVVVCFLQPFFNVPLIDDWAYYRTVETTLTTGQYRLHDWLTANPPAHTLWGQLFCMLFGLSFTSLQFSTSVLAGFGAIGFYLYGQVQGLSRSVSLFLTLTLILSPLYCCLNASFMTDIPFMTYCIWSLYWYQRAMQSNNWWSWLLGAVFASLAILTRQFGLGLLLSAALAVWCSPHRSQAWWRAALTLLLPLGAVAWQVQEGFVHSNWAAQFNKFAFREHLSHPSKVAAQVVWRIIEGAQYISMHCAPVLLLLLWLQPRRYLFRLISIGIVVLGQAYFITACLWFDMPMNYFPYPSAGTLRIFFLVAFPIQVLNLLTVGLVVLSIVFWSFWTRRENIRIDRSTWPLLAFTLASLGLILLYFHMFDRYILMLMPLVLLLLGRQLPADRFPWRPALVLGICLWGPMLLMNWNCKQLIRISFQFGDELVRDGVPPNEISLSPSDFAGWKWEGLHNFEVYRQTQSPNYSNAVVGYITHWSPAREDETRYHVVLNAAPITGYEKWTLLKESRMFSPIRLTWIYFGVFRRP